MFALDYVKVEGVHDLDGDILAPNVFHFMTFGSFFIKARPIVLFKYAKLSKFQEERGNWNELKSTFTRPNTFILKKA